MRTNPIPDSGIIFQNHAMIQGPFPLLHHVDEDDRTKHTVGSNTIG